MSPRKRLGVVIVNYGTPALVIDCLCSLQGEIVPGQDAVVVVDNGSADGSPEFIEARIREAGWGSWARLVRSPHNNGFSAGTNMGLQEVEAEAYLLLNSDTTVKPGAIDHLLASLRARPDAGIVSPRLEAPDGSPAVNCFRKPTPIGELIKGAQTGLITRMLRRFDVPLPPADERFECDWTGFAAVLIRADVFREVGYLDEGYFMYFEDIDFCRRAAQAGWRTLHWPTARVMHLHGKSGSVVERTEARKRRPRYYYESRSRYFAKFYGRTGLWFANLLWWAGALIALAQEVIGHRKGHICKREYLDIWTHCLRSPARPARPQPIKAKGD
ncbi:MAG TPA: glycosyltransferase family 2 protein [Candidatus Hydrogenedentes bacterium]|nr:glycosyltransferase family 2 protein [Candidatus Hydrogenedentota bacterium]